MDEGEKMMVVYSQYDKAEELFTKAIKYDHGNFEAYYFRGCAKINNNKLMEAIADFEKAIELKPDFADAYFNIGRAYFLLHGQWHVFVFCARDGSIQIVDISLQVLAMVESYRFLADDRFQSVCLIGQRNQFVFHVVKN